MRLVIKVLFLVKDIEIGDVENKKIDGLVGKILIRIYML